MEDDVMKGKMLLTLLVAVIFLVFYSPIPVMADQTDKLIKILIEKKIITPEEAKSLEKEVKEAPSEKEAKKETPPGDDWTKKVEVGYKKGAYIKSADDSFSLKVNVRTQGLFRYESLEDRDDTASFSVKRARILASGNVFYPWMNYNTQVTLEGNNTALRDAYIEATYFDWLQPRIGQYKLPFDREFLTSAFNLQLIDRSIASNEFSLQRDTGLQFSGQFLKDQLNYGIGIFNGSGANQSNQDQNFMYVGRMVWNPFGSYPYSQAALDTPDRPKLAVGFAGAYLPGIEPGERRTLAGRLGNTNIVPVNSDVYQMTADLAFKYRNLSFEGGYHFRNIDPEKPTTYGEESAQGFYIQGGYFLIPKKLELALRYSWVDPDNPNQKNNDEQEEYTGGLTYYMYGHDLKLQGNYSYFDTDTNDSDRDDHVVQGMITLAF